MPGPKITVNQIAKYYNANTRLFMRLGGSGDAIAAIHRQLWGPGVRTSRASFEYLNQLVIAALQPALSLSPSPRLLDLGCGLGGTTTWAARNLNTPVVGVTVSEAQVIRAKERAAGMGLTPEECQFIQGDFHALPEIGMFQGAWAVESFIHSIVPARFFEQAVKHLTPGGRLVIADDFLTTGEVLSKQAARWVNAFQTGWYAPALMTVAQAQELANEAGFTLVEHQDLTPYIRTFHPWLVRIAFLLLKLPIQSVYWDSLRGSTALQMCIHQGWTGYHLLTWEKQSGGRSL